MRKIFYSFVIILIFVLLIVCVIHILETQKNDITEFPYDIDTTSINSVYEYVDKCANEKLGEDYELYQINVRHDKEFSGKIEFVYTERTKYFREVYFITLDTIKKEISYRKQNEAERMYGRNIILKPKEWKVSARDILMFGAGREYDFVKWHTVYEDKISIKYIKNDEVIYNVDVNSYTKQILGKW